MNREKKLLLKEFWWRLRQPFCLFISRNHLRIPRNRPLHPCPERPTFASTWAPDQEWIWADKDRDNYHKSLRIQFLRSFGQYWCKCNVVRRQQPPCKYHWEVVQHWRWQVLERNHCHRWLQTILVFELHDWKTSLENCCGTKYLHRLALSTDSWKIIRASMCYCFMNLPINNMLQFRLV